MTPKSQSRSQSLKEIGSCSGTTAAGNLIKYLHTTRIMQSSKNKDYAPTLTTRTMWRRSLILEHMRGVNSREKTCLSFTVQEAAVEQASIQIAYKKTFCVN